MNEPKHINHTRKKEVLFAGLDVHAQNITRDLWNWIDQPFATPPEGPPDSQLALILDSARRCSEITVETFLDGARGGKWSAEVARVSASKLIGMNRKKRVLLAACAK